MVCAAQQDSEAIARSIFGEIFFRYGSGRSVARISASNRFTFSVILMSNPSVSINAKTLIFRGFWKLLGRSLVSG
jgi:hypothetical protein